MPGFRTRQVTLVTTLLDAQVYGVADLAELYQLRWQVETALAHLKTTMQMEVLHCKTVSGVLKELTVFALVYNLVRLVICRSAML
jgi:IS4 transposase